MRTKNFGGRDVNIILNQMSAIYIFTFTTETVEEERITYFLIWPSHVAFLGPREAATYRATTDYTVVCVQ